MDIHFFIKSVYGTPHLYASDPAIADTIQRLTGHKTITRTVYKCLEELGIEFVQDVTPFE